MKLPSRNGLVDLEQNFYLKLGTQRTPVRPVIQQKNLFKPLQFLIFFKPQVLLYKRHSILIQQNYLFFFFWSISL